MANEEKKAKTAEKPKKAEEVRMVKVINEGHRGHKVHNFIQEVLPSGKKHRVQILDKEYKWGKMERKRPTALEVPLNDLLKMIDPEDFTKGKIWTLEQWEERLDLIEEREILVEEFNAATGAKQVELAQKLLMTDEQRYLMLNTLPHLVDPLEEIIPVEE